MALDVPNVYAVLPSIKMTVTMSAHRRKRFPSMEPRILQIVLPASASVQNMMHQHASQAVQQTKQSKLSMPGTLLAGVRYVNAVKDMSMMNALKNAGRMGRCLHHCQVDVKHVHACAQLLIKMHAKLIVNKMERLLD